MKTDAATSVEQQADGNLITNPAPWRMNTVVLNLAYPNSHKPRRVYEPPKKKRLNISPNNLNRNITLPLPSNTIERKYFY